MTFNNEEATIFFAGVLLGLLIIFGLLTLVLYFQNRDALNRVIGQPTSVIISSNGLNYKGPLIGFITLVLVAIIVTFSSSSNKDKESIVINNCIQIQDAKNLIKLKNNMDQIEGMNGSGGLYTIKKILSSDEIIKGKKGTYYRIDLNNAKYSELMKFGLEEFEADQLTNYFASFTDAITTDINDALAKGGFEHEFFIRGSADRGNNRPLGELNEVKRVDYFPKEGNYYLSDPITKKIPINYTNVDLPYLRADYVKGVLTKQIMEIKKQKSLSADIKINLLEGRITPNLDENDRVVNVFLFVNWN